MPGRDFASEVSPYRATFGSINGHIASFFGYCKLPVRLGGGVREIVPLQDGGRLMLHWWSGLPTSVARPVVMLIPGINNSSSTPYL
jgi:predicted alpha/beta-fold hydrolase